MAIQPFDEPIQVNRIALFVQADRDVFEIYVKCNGLGLNAKDRFKRLEDHAIDLWRLIGPDTNTRIALHLDTTDQRGYVRAGRHDNQFVYWFRIKREILDDEGIGNMPTIWHIERLVANPLENLLD